MLIDWMQVALDYNAPLLTLAAAHVINDSSDPFYTTLQAGAYDSRRPKGQPCDAAIPCHNLDFPETGQIIVGLAVTAVGLIILGLLATWITVSRRDGGGGAKS